MTPRSILLVVASAACLLLSAVPTFAAGDTACVPDCFADKFSTPEKAILELPGGCYIRVTYAQRFACGRYYDVAILEVEVLGGNCAMLPLPDLLQQATVQLLVDNPMYFPEPAPDSCITTWRVTKGSCWTYDTVDCTGDTVAVPCDGVGCCLSSYEICADTAGNRTIALLGASSSGASCDSTNPACVPICQGADSMVVQPADIDVTEYSRLREIVEARYAAAVTDIVPNPASGTVGLDLEVKRADHVIIDLYGSDGSQLARIVDQPFERGRHHVQFDASRLTSGTYHFQVRSMGGTTSGSFVVTH